MCTGSYANERKPKIFSYFDRKRAIDFAVHMQYSKTYLEYWKLIAHGFRVLPTEKWHSQLFDRRYGLYGYINL